MLGVVCVAFNPHKFWLKCHLLVVNWLLMSPWKPQTRHLLPFLEDVAASSGSDSTLLLASIAPGSTEIQLGHKTEKGLRAAYTIHTSYSTGLHKYQWTAKIPLWKEFLAYLVRSWIHKKCLSFWTLLAPAYICYWAIGCGWHILQG